MVFWGEQGGGAEPARRAQKHDWVVFSVSVATYADPFIYYVSLSLRTCACLFCCENVLKAGKMYRKRACRCTHPAPLSLSRAASEATPRSHHTIFPRLPSYRPPPHTHTHTHTYTRTYTRTFNRSTSPPPSLPPSPGSANEAARPLLLFSPPGGVVVVVRRRRWVVGLALPHFTAM